jgi:hypothetical protein
MEAVTTAGRNQYVINIHLTEYNKYPETFVPRTQLPTDGTSEELHGSQNGVFITISCFKKKSRIKLILALCLLNNRFAG